MGVKRVITKEDIPLAYRDLELKPSEDGVVASVYLLGDSLVLKLFEKDTPTLKIENEIYLLQELKGLLVPKVIDHFMLEGYHILIYTQLLGESLKVATKEHIEQIGLFLKEFHLQSKTIKLPYMVQEYSNDKLKQMIEATKDPRFYRAYLKYKIALKCDGIIHGDLFLDNCKFVGSSLSGVYDFSDIGVGDFYFDLAVVAISWCFDKDELNRAKVETLLNSYGSKIAFEEFLDYIGYALLFYASRRYLAKRNYQELFRRLERL